MIFSEAVAIDVEKEPGGVALVLTADRSRPSKGIKGAQIERIRLDREAARTIMNKIAEALA